MRQPDRPEPRRSCQRGRRRGSPPAGPEPAPERNADGALVSDIIDRFDAWRSDVAFVDETYLPGFLRSGNRTAIFEGAQGVLLDENFGFHPHTTWSTTTFKNADELLKGEHSGKYSPIEVAQWIEDYAAAAAGHLAKAEAQAVEERIKEIRG